MRKDGNDELREKDLAVLQSIQEGKANTRDIREATTLSNRDVNYALDKLEELGLIQTTTPPGRVTEIVDGQKRNFRAPREATLTDLGNNYSMPDGKRRFGYEKYSRNELIERVHNLEKEVEDLRATFEAFRKQVTKKLD